MALSDLEVFALPVEYFLRAVVRGLDRRELRTVAVLDVGAPIPEEMSRARITSLRGVSLYAEGSIVVAVFATPLEGVRCALELAELADPGRGRATGALHDGLMSDDTSDDLVEPVSRSAAELADLATPGQLLVTGAVRDGMPDDPRIGLTHVGTTRLLGQMMEVLEVRRVGERRP